MSFLDWRPAAFAALCIAAAVSVGCGGTVIDDAKTEGAIQHNLESSLGKKVEKVDCPSGVDVKAGAKFECAVTLKGGKEETASLKIINEDADVELVALNAAK
jgi:hypothetical protein